MKCSIALTTYNGEKYLPLQLNSLLEQTRQPDQLIICDDGSKDGTLKILENFRTKAPFEVRIEKNPENLGFAQNFAKAISLCSQEVIFLCDQDDRWLPNKIKSYLDEFERKPQLDALFGDSLIVDESMRPLQSFLEMNLFTELEKDQFHRGDGWKVLLKRNIIAGHALAFRKAEVEWLLPIPADQIHDAWLVTLLAFAKKIDYLDGIFVHYRQHQKQNIGVIAGNPIDRLKARYNRAALRKDKDLVRELKFYSEILERLGSMANQSRKDRIKNKIHWLESRLQLSQNRLLRFPSIIKNLESYKEFDNGFPSAVKDLIFKK